LRITYLFHDIFDIVKSIIPVVSVLVFFQVVVLRQSLAHPKTFFSGIVLAIVGLFLFLKGVTMSLIPLGESVGQNIVTLDNKLLISIFAFVVGYGATLVEPALRTLVLEVEEVSVGAIPEKVLLHTIAIGFGLGVTLGIIKIVSNIPTVKIVIPLLLFALYLAYLAPEKMVGIAFDCASATTGPVNIPINVALALGLSRVVEGSDPLLNGFGIVGLSSLGTIIAVLMLGIITKA
jgi:hypothetical protein